MLRLLATTAMILCVMTMARPAMAQTATQDINISALVPKSCTIENVAAGAVDTATIAITAAGAVDTSPVTPTSSPYANVACNTPSDLQLTSLSGAVINASSLAGFTNIIDYTASATWHGVTATLNTATAPAAAGAESGTAQPVATGFSGALSVLITPTANTLPLVQGAYADTLSVTLTPQ